MAQICKYENVVCAYCGERDELKYLYSTRENQHEVLCLVCGGMFNVPCED